MARTLTKGEYVIPNIYNVEITSASRTEFRITFKAATDAGDDIRVTIVLPCWFIPHIVDAFRKIADEWQKQLDVIKAALR